MTPFDKSDVSKMKTTNDIERCVLHKIFNEHLPESLGIIEAETGELTVRKIFSITSFVFRVIPIQY